MKKLSLALLVLLVAGSLEASSAVANDPAGYPFFPFGFYQPYGAAYRSSIPTPPYFATNPPVYYGTRYARPYGISPFAAPPVISAPAGYQAHPAASFVSPPPMGQPVCNPYCQSPEEAGVAPVGTRGKVQQNPFVEQPEQVARS